MVLMLVREDRSIDSRHSGDIELARRPDNADAAAMAKGLDQQGVDKNTRARRREHPALVTKESGLKHRITPAAGPTGRPSPACNREPVYAAPLQGAINFP